MGFQVNRAIFALEGEANLQVDQPIVGTGPAAAATAAKTAEASGAGR